MAAITLSVSSARETDRVLKTRRDCGIPSATSRQEAGDRKGARSNGTTSRPPRSNVSEHSSDNDHEQVVAARKPINRQDNATDRTIDQQQQHRRLQPPIEHTTSPTPAKHSPAPPATGDINKGQPSRPERGSRHEKPVSAAATVDYTYPKPVKVNGGREQVSGGGPESHVIRRGLKSILKEHQSGTLADKTQRRTSYSAGGKQQQQSDEKNQRPPSVDDNQSRAGSSSGIRDHIEREQSAGQQKTARGDIEAQGKLVARDTTGNNLEPEDDQDIKGNWSTSARGKRPPTFGTTPYKLSRLPYYSYYGKARNVSLVNRVNRAGQEEREQVASKIETGGESSGRSSTSLSQQSLSSLSSHTGGRNSSNRAHSVSRAREARPEERIPYRESSASRKGYSNISNLFPGEPTQVRRPEWRAGLHSQQANDQLINRNQSNSLSNLSQQKKSFRERGAELVNNKLLGGSQGEYLEKDLSAERKMRRQNSNLSGKPTGFSTRYNSAQARSTSAFGGHSLSQYHRSPSAMSLMYGGSTGVSPVYGGQGPIDPDCPVHGYSPLGATMSKSTQQLNTAGDGFGPAEADLLYETQVSAAQYTDRVGRNLYRTGSPSQPLMTSHGGATLTKRQPSSVTTTTAPASYLHGPPPSGAYYNGPNRFSVYHSMSNDFGTRTSLAPPSEQLRRILGYQPHPRPVHLHPQWAYSRPFIHLQDSGWRSPSPTGPLDPVTGQPQIKPVFMAYNQLVDTQAVRAVDFHPSGEVYAVGSNSRVLRICAYPADYELRHYDRDRPSNAPRVLFKFLQVHRGSIYCVQFNATGQLLATGSNDQTVHIARYNSTTHCPDGDEFRLTMHDGTVRDLCFIDDSTNGSALLLSAGGGDNKIYVTDCDTITPFQSMTGHTQTVMSLHHWGGANFVSASLDKSIRFWDLRTRSCTSIVSALPSAGSPQTINHKWAGPGAPVCAVKVDPSGRLMASGHSDSTCMLYDIRGARIIQSYKPHDDEVRTLSFSPKSYYLLSGGYDGRIMLTDLQGDLTQTLPTCCVAECDDKIVQAKWHPSDFTFVTTSADKTATLWALPTE